MKHINCLLSSDSSVVDLFSDFSLLSIIRKNGGRTASDAVSAQIVAIQTDHSLLTDDTFCGFQFEL